jgi:hypothetical protein
LTLGRPRSAAATVSSRRRPGSRGSTVSREELFSKKETEKTLCYLCYLCCLRAIYSRRSGLGAEAG